MKTLFEDFKLNLLSLLYYPIFIFRRIILVLVLIYLQNYGLFQISIQVVISFATLVYAIEVRPYKDDRLNQQEIVNEFFTWLTAYYMLIFSNWVPDDATMPYSDLNLKTAVGRTMLGLVGVIIVTNIFIITKEIVLALKAKLRLRKKIQMTLELEEHKHKQVLRKKRLEATELSSLPKQAQPTIIHRDISIDIESHFVPNLKIESRVRPDQERNV